MKKKFFQKFYYSFKFGGWHYVWLKIRDQLLKTENAGEYLYIKSKEAVPEQYEAELAEIYGLRIGRKLNLANPVTFTEKIQWMKLYDSTPLKTTLADKYLVREWIRGKIGEQYLIPLLGVWDNFAEIEMNKMPNTFVLKTNHGSGYIEVVKDKEKVDWNKIQIKFDRWMARNYAFKSGFELQYLNIRPRIIAEEYIESAHGSLYDYKIHCFNGKVKYIQLVCERNLETQYRETFFFDANWTLQPFNYSNNELSLVSLEQVKDKRPKKLEEMLQIADILCKGFAYVRVDLYELDNGDIKFGEMTFTPYSGFMTWNSPEVDKMLGELIELPPKSEIPRTVGNI